MLGIGIALLLLAASPCGTANVQFPAVGTMKPLPSTSVPKIVQAIEDEVYDYKQENSFTNIGTTGAISGPTKVAVFISKFVSNRNVGWVLYKDMPHGEVLRRYLIRSDGLVVLYGDPGLDFPAQLPDTKTIYIPEKSVCHFIASSLETTFIVDPNVSKQRIAEAEHRQLLRVKYSYSLDQFRKQR